MTHTTLAAAIQMASGPDVGTNLEDAGRLLAQAAEQGATLAVLPENFALQGMADADRVRHGEPDGEGPLQSFLADRARKLGLWIVGGTIPLTCGQPNRVYASCLVYDDQGRRVARYDKIHLFDVHLPERDETYRESAATRPGGDLAVLDSPVGRLGLAVCYDLRFPEMFRAMLDQGMETLALPSAFTAVTGQAHWEILVRARAVENVCFVIAAAQGGRHVNGRQTHGESMIVDPWGTVLGRLEKGPGLVVAEVDSGRVTELRHRFPALRHRRFAGRMAED